MGSTKCHLPKNKKIRKYEKSKNTKTSPHFKLHGPHPHPTRSSNFHSTPYLNFPLMPFRPPVIHAGPTWVFWSFSRCPVPFSFVCSVYLRSCCFSAAIHSLLSGGLVLCVLLLEAYTHTYIYTYIHTYLLCSKSNPKKTQQKKKGSVTLHGLLSCSAMVVMEFRTLTIRAQKQQQLSMFSLRCLLNTLSPFFRLSSSVVLLSIFTITCFQKSYSFCFTFSSLALPFPSLSFDCSKNFIFLPFLEL